MIAIMRVFFFNFLFAQRERFCSYWNSKCLWNLNSHNVRNRGWLVRSIAFLLPWLLSFIVCYMFKGIAIGQFPVSFWTMTYFGTLINHYLVNKLMSEWITLKSWECKPDEKSFLYDVQESYIHWLYSIVNPGQRLYSNLHFKRVSCIMGG